MLATARVALKKLARDLVQNHFDVSLYRDKRAYAQIFGESAHYLDPSRNVLIVGAGASKNSHDNFQLSSDILTDLCFKQLKLHELIGGSEKFSLRFRQEASKTANHRFASWNDVTAILKKLIASRPFEDCLNLFAQFTTGEDLSAKLKLSVVALEVTEKTRVDALRVYEHLPCLLYEIIAHLFKHRYFDVIINMNFDEMLDNAIEDEMGDSTYIKVVNDSDVKRLSEIVDGERLRVPIYIKPHGTFRSNDSMRFTHERYLTQPTSLNSLFDDIFSGSTNNPTITDVKRVNVITVGYSFSDIDIQTPIFEQHAKSRIKLSEASHKMYDGIKELNFYFFNVSDSCKTNLLTAFDTWFDLEYPTRQRTPEQRALYKNLKKDLQGCVSVILPDIKDPSKIKNLPAGTFAKSFRDLYAEIEKVYDSNTPYQPKGLARHELLCKLFDRGYVKKGFQTSNSYLNQTPHDFLYKLACYHALYALIKFHGNIPLNEITHNRPGKYFFLYKKSIEGHPDYPKRFKPKENMIEFLKQLVDKVGCNLKRSSGYLICESRKGLPWASFADELLEAVAMAIHKKSMSDFDLNGARTITDGLKKHVMGKSRREINAIYNDRRHGFFWPFDQSSIINTNLEFTYRFFDIAAKDDWRTMCMIDNNGKPIFNLYNYSPEKDCLFEKFKSRGQSVYLLRTSNDTIGNDRRGKNKDGDNPVNIVEKIKAILDENFQEAETVLENNVHKMALFLDDKFQPLYGIYFFQPSTKARVNPVYFEAKDENTRQNLKIMYELFHSCIDKEQKKWLDYFPENI